MNWTSMFWDHRSCGDRHCPQCQGRATEAWSERQSANQLSVPYFHLVFTLPHRLNPWVQSHPEVIYRALFHAAWGTLDAFGHDPKRLGGQLGMTGVLHTWGQSLCQHVHLHCMVPGGALADDGTRLPVKGSYLFPVRALSRHFRGRMVSALRSAAKAGGELTGIDPAAVSALLDALMADRGVGGLRQALPGAHRVADRLSCPLHRSHRHQQRAHPGPGRRSGKPGLSRLPRRPTQDADAGRPGIHPPLPAARAAQGADAGAPLRVLGNRCRVQRLVQIRELLAAPPPEPEPEAEAEQGHEHEPGWPCPVCRRGRMRPVRESPPRRAALGCAPYR